MARTRPRIATPVAATYGSARVASRSASRPIAPSIAAPDATSARRPDHRPSATMTTPPASTEAPWVRASSPNAVARTSGGASTSSTPTTSAASRSPFGSRHEMRGTARTRAIVMTPKAAVEASSASGAAAARTTTRPSVAIATAPTSRRPRALANRSRITLSARSNSVRVTASDSQLRTYVGPRSASVAAICAGR